jgi:serine/threonine-protein phosphatase 2B regulatory subunit
MGKSQSRIMSASEAKERLSSEEWDRFSRGFDRLVKDGSLKFNEFFIEVLGASVPRDLADRIFDVFDYSQRGSLVKEDFMTGMAVLAHGIPEERVKFLFQVYDLDKEGYIRKENLKVLAKCLKDTFTAESIREFLFSFVLIIFW